MRYGAGAGRSAAQALGISAGDRANLDILLKDLTDFAFSASGAGHAGLITRERHRKAFATAAEALARIEAPPEAPVEIRRSTCAPLCSPLSG